MFSEINSAKSLTTADPSLIFLTPSVIIVLQNGQPVAIISGLKDNASFVLLILIS